MNRIICCTTAKKPSHRGVRKKLGDEIQEWEWLWLTEVLKTLKNLLSEVFLTASKIIAHESILAWIVVLRVSLLMVHASLMLFEQLSNWVYVSIELFIDLAVELVLVVPASPQVGLVIFPPEYNVKKSYYSDFF